MCQKTDGVFVRCHVMSGNQVGSDRGTENEEEEEDQPA